MQRNHENESNSFSGISAICHVNRKDTDIWQRTSRTYGDIFQIVYPAPKTLHCVPLHIGALAASESEKSCSHQPQFVCINQMYFKFCP